METVHWSKLYKNSAMQQTPTVEMLRAEGVDERKVCKLQGEKNNAEKKERFIIFDREFVLVQISKRNRFLIADLSRIEWLKLCEQVYEYAIANNISED